LLLDVLALATLRHVAPLFPASTYIPTSELECRAGDGRAKAELGFASSIEAEASYASRCRVRCVRECVARQPPASSALHSPHVQNVPLISVNITVGLRDLLRILLLLRGAGKCEIANERAADDTGQQPVARPAESPLQLDDNGP
jgi:hypothetical protein